MPTEALYGLLVSIEAGIGASSTSTSASIESIESSATESTESESGARIVAVEEIPASEARVESLEANVAEEKITEEEAPSGNYNEIRASPVLRIS